MLALVTAQPGSYSDLLDAGSVVMLSGVVAVLWRRNNALEERTRADLIQALTAMTAGASAIKDVTKAVERLEERIRESA